MARYTSVQAWNQCRAALLFWAEVSECSRTHPMHHPSVASMFDNIPPMSTDDIKDLAAHEHPPRPPRATPPRKRK